MTKKTSYIEAIAEIEETIQKIENYEYSIDDLAEKVKRISFLISSCKEKLHATEEEVNAILKKMQE
jgi:exodeoxyribonuclease VII small subunit